jgi:hypothetical protein
MPNVQIQWPAEDLKRIGDAISRAQIGLGKTLAQALEWAGVYLAQSAGKATNVAPKTRKAIANPGERVVIYRNGVRRETDYASKNYPYYREVWGKNYGGPDSAYRWYLRDRGDPAKQRIVRSGLARKSWLWMLPGIRGAGGANFAYEVNKRGSGGEIEIEMANKLPYITKALKLSDNGAALLSQALHAAGKRMEHEVDRRMQRAVS